MPVADEVAARFWAKVDKRQACWIWTASVFDTGAGQFRIGRRNVLAHRVAWELVHMTPPNGALRSGCGDLRCVNPDHRVLAPVRSGPVNLGRPASRRFAAMVNQGPECWLWAGSTDSHGYGQFSVSSEGRRRMVRAHRFARELVYGPVPAGFEVVHSCVNRTCVRPEHLVLRDPAEALRLPTPLQLKILQAWTESEMRRGSLRRVAAQMGLRHATVVKQVSEARKRIGVAGTQEAVRWLDDRQPGWRDYC